MLEITSWKLSTKRNALFDQPAETAISNNFYAPRTKAHNAFLWTVFAPSFALPHVYCDENFMIQPLSSDLDAYAFFSFLKTLSITRKKPNPWVCGIFSFQLKRIRRLDMAPDWRMLNTLSCARWWGDQYTDPRLVRFEIVINVSIWAKVHLPLP